MPRIILVLVFTFLCNLTAGAGEIDKAGKRKPNILVIFVDDLGYGELGCQGNKQIATPHIDTIATNGIRFTDGYVSSPYCCPSRAGLLTGRIQTRFGHELNAVGKQNLEPHVGLPTTEITLADLLKRAGYVTGLVGKWHLGGTAKYHPQRRGFDEFFGFLHEGHFFVPPPYKGVTSRLRPNEPPYDEGNPLLRGNNAVVESKYLTRALTREAVGFIQRNKSQPFFLYLSYNAVHSPMQAPNESLDALKNINESHRRLFAAMLTELDRSVGAVLDKLRELNLEEDTLIFFLSDNGGPTAELTSSNSPLRGGKGQLWEGGVRIPFMIQWKGHLPAGQVYQYPVISLDILPTAVSAAGGKLPADRVMDGVDLLPHLTKQRDGRPHDVLFWRYGPNIALRKGDWKLVRQAERGQARARFQLFHLPSDIGESKDMSQIKPDITRDLLATLQQWDRQMIEPRWNFRSAKVKKK